MTLLIDKVPFNPKKGRTPSSKEYDLGTKIYQALKPGLSVFISEEEKVDERKLRVRLTRLGGEGSFSIQKGVNERTDLFYSDGKSEIIKNKVTGFRVHRLK